MSEMSSRFDWFCQLTAERLAQASGNAPTSETGVGLLPLNLVDEHELRMALDALGVVLDAEPICLLDPRWWGDRVPQKPKLTLDVSLLSRHQWRRYANGKRAGPAATHVVAMWHRRLHQLAQALEDRTLLCLLGHSEPPHDRAVSPCDSDLRFAASALSTLYPISANAFITLAASVGLFCSEPPVFLRDENGTCERALYCLSRREYAVRIARTADIDAPERLDELCWVPPLRSPKQSLLARIETFQQGQFALEFDGEVKGVIHSQCIGDEAELGQCTMDNAHPLHEPTGDVLQLLAANIDPDCQNLACGNLDPHQWVDRIPQKPALTADIGLLSGHQWQRYGKGRRAVSAARVVTMWQQHLHHLADPLEERTLFCLLSHSEPPRDGGPRASQSSNSTGMW